jgi:hypothetical protein
MDSCKPPPRRRRARFHAASRPSHYRLDGELPTLVPVPEARPQPLPAGPLRTTNEERQVFCPHYDACLAEAARKGWDDFTCRLCPLSTRVAAPSALQYANDRHSRD